jgi:hypothetical protein
MGGTTKPELNKSVTPQSSAIYVAKQQNTMTLGKPITYTLDKQTHHSSQHTEAATKNVATNHSPNATKWGD